MTAAKKHSDLQVTRAEAAHLQKVGASLTDCRHAFAALPGGIFGAIAAGSEIFSEWQRYPVGEVYDQQSHAQYFYHAHPEGQRSPREHGHFHTFLRAEGMPAGVAPLVLPETALANGSPSLPQAAPRRHGSRDEVSHLIAIALDARGEPIQLFTTNRWVTGETWYRADDVIRMLDCFTLGAADGPTVLNRWISAVVALFRPQIAALLRLRDDTVMNWRRRRRANIFEDTRIEVTSSFDIDLDTQLKAVDRLQSEFAVDPTICPARLPPMAQGWGGARAG